MRRLLSQILDLFSSLGLCCLLLVLLGLLTWMGTLDQVHMGLFEVQKKYFESYVLWHDLGPFSIPLPGANLVMSVLFVNLLLGGVVRLRKGKATVGILVTHLGILMMLGSGFVKAYSAVEGHMSLFEGQSEDHYQSYYRWELALIEDLEEGGVNERVLPHNALSRAGGPRGEIFPTPEMPFTITVSRYAPNSEPMPKGPAFEVAVPVIEGVFLKELPKDPKAERNLAGAYVTVLGRDGAKNEGIVWGAERAPWTFSADGRRFGITLRRERYPLPFSIRLEKFTKEDHPGTTMARAFSSDVTVIEENNRRPVKIFMNEPLRERGYVLYQASWGPANAEPGEPLFSTLDVVQNPADQFPLYSCLVITAGFLIHFVRKLLLVMRSGGGAS